MDEVAGYVQRNGLDGRTEAALRLLDEAGQNWVMEPGGR
eukprot:gene43489-66182_t